MLWRAGSGRPEKPRDGKPLYLWVQANVFSVTYVRKGCKVVDDNQAALRPAKFQAARFAAHAVDRRSRRGVIWLEWVRKRGKKFFPLCRFSRFMPEWFRLAGMGGDWELGKRLGARAGNQSASACRGQ